MSLTCGPNETFLRQSQPYNPRSSLRPASASGILATGHKAATLQPTGMAGGGAAASALSSPWRTLLQWALDANAHLKHSTFFQLVRSDLPFPSPFGATSGMLTIDAFRPRWAPAAGRRIGPSCSGTHLLCRSSLSAPFHFAPVLI
jgi:hypothetical protein